MNKVILMGRLVKDVETRYTQTNNTTVASFTIAVERKFKKENEQDADFINIVAWSKTAEFISKYFAKGMRIAVVGILQTRNYEDKDGKKVFVTEVIAEEVEFADSKKENNNNETTIPDMAVTTENIDDDLPF